MIRMGETITTCRQVEVQDDAVALPLFDRLLTDEYSDPLWEQYQAATKPVWRVESFRRGLCNFKPTLQSQGLWDDFESAEEALAFVRDLNAESTRLSTLEWLDAWVWEIGRSFRDLWRSLAMRLFGSRRSRLDHSV